MALETEHHTVTKRILEAIRKQKTKYTVPDEEYFNRIIDNFISDVCQHKKDRAPHEIASLFKSGITASGYQSVWHQLTQMSKGITTLTDEIKQAHRSDTRSHIKSLIFKVLTTFCIGLTIMFIYYLANKWHIPLPLMRMPV